MRGRRAEQTDESTFALGEIVLEGLEVRVVHFDVVVAVQLPCVFLWETDRAVLERREDRRRDHVVVLVNASGHCDHSIGAGCGPSESWNPRRGGGRGASRRESPLESVLDVPLRTSERTSRQKKKKIDRNSKDEENGAQ